MENNLLDIFLNDHISQEITNREFPNGCILIYKGFPIDFIVKTAGKFSFINAPEDILKGGKLNLQFILDHNRETIQKLFNIKSGIHVLTYEELLMVSEKVDLSLFNPDILIFDNNLLKEYPAQVIAEIPDLDNIVEKTDMSFQENNLINHFYAYSASKFGINLIQYKDINVKEENKGEIHNFFKEDLLSYSSSRSSFRLVSNPFTIFVEENKEIPD